MIEWAIPANGLLVGDERLAAHTLSAGFGFDVFSQPMFWECVVARQLGGIVTAHKELHDIEVNIWGRDCFAEVKFSRSYLGHFSRIRGKDWSRPVFKWAQPRGGSGKNTADAVILIGMDQEMIFSWAVPIGAISPTCASITMTAPLSRSGKQRSPWDDYAVPFDAILPAFARICHRDMFDD